MNFICIKYSGLKFNFIFETAEFIFIPQRHLEDVRDFSSYRDDFFTVKYDMDSEFYLIRKFPTDLDLTLGNFSEEALYRFKFLEAIIALLFSNFLRRKLIFILEKVDSDYKIKKIFKKISKDSKYNSDSLIWKNEIVIDPLKEFIGDALKKLEEINLKHPDDIKHSKKADFAFRYFFCIDMYLRGKFGEKMLRTSSDLWICIEILSVITISRLLHSHEEFRVQDFYSTLQKNVELTSSKIPKDKIDCWGKMKKDFPEFMKNKINKYLPIKQKVIAVVREYLSNDDIKVKLERENYENAREFIEYQESISIEKIIKVFYDSRNKLFHRGGLDEDWTIQSDRDEANFIKIIEQLFIKILGIKNVVFDQIGYPYQRILIDFHNGTSNSDISNYNNSRSIFISKKYILSLEADVRTDNSKIKEYYVKKRQDLFPLRVQLNNRSKEIDDFIKGSHAIKIKHKDSEFNCTLNFQEIKEKNFSFSSLLHVRILMRYIISCKILRMLLYGMKILKK